jgi:hypothetical protein
MVLFTDRDLAELSVHSQHGSGGQDLFKDFTFVGLRAAQGPAGQVRAQHGLSQGGALDRRGANDLHVIASMVVCCPKALTSYDIDEASLRSRLLSPNCSGK